MSELRVDAEKLAKSIEAIPGICEDGKKAVRQLFEEGFGVKFEEPTPLEIGEVYYSGGDKNDPRLLIAHGNNFGLWKLVDKRSKGIVPLEIGLCSESELRNHMKKFSYKPSGHTPEEYFNLKREGKL